MPGIRQGVVTAAVEECNWTGAARGVPPKNGQPPDRKTPGEMSLREDLIYVLGTGYYAQWRSRAPPNEYNYLAQFRYATGTRMPVLHDRQLKSEVRTTNVAKLNTLNNGNTRSLSHECTRTTGYPSYLTMLPSIWSPLRILLVMRYLPVWTGGGIPRSAWQPLRVARQGSYVSGAIFSQNSDAGIPPYMEWIIVLEAQLHADRRKPLFIYPKTYAEE